MGWCDGMVRWRERLVRWGVSRLRALVLGEFFGVLGGGDVRGRLGWMWVVIAFGL